MAGPGLQKGPDPPRISQAVIWIKDSRTAPPRTDAGAASPAQSEESVQEVLQISEDMTWIEKQRRKLRQGKRYCWIRSRCAAFPLPRDFPAPVRPCRKRASYSSLFCQLFHAAVRQVPVCFVSSSTPRVLQLRSGAGRDWLLGPAATEGVPRARAAAETERDGQAQQNEDCGSVRRR